MADYPEVIRTAVEMQVRLRADAIETMCERMLVTPGDYGVLVTDFSDGAWQMELSREVPPMTIGYRRQEATGA